MGYVVKLHFHPKKTEGIGYDVDRREIVEKKIGKPFEDTPLEKLAAVLISQMARRDVLIFDVEVEEYIKRSVTFKECKDGKGIVLKGKRFSLDNAAAIIEEDIEEEQPQPGLQPHERVAQNLDQLYTNPNSIIPVKRNIAPVNPNRILYWAYYSPTLGREPKGVRFTADKKYPVHQIVQSASGRLDQQEIIVTDDAGKQIKASQDWFVTVGNGLLADNELGFSQAQNNDIQLNYGGEVPAGEMPVLRR